MGNQGLQGGWALDNNGQVDFPHSLKNQLPLMKSAGAGWVRIEFRLGQYYSDWTTPGADGTTALQKYESVVSAAQTHSLEIVGLVSSQSWHGDQSDWCANNAENNVGANGDNIYVTNLTKNAALVLMQHFAGSISAWEIWNEPNAYKCNPSPGVFTCGSFLYPSNFAWLLQHTYEYMQLSKISGITVISGGLLGQDLSGDNPGDKYLTCTYTQGIKNAGWSHGSYPMDVIGQHIYIDQLGSTSTSHLQTFLSAIRDAYMAFEGKDTPKKTVITEVGWTTASVSPEVQASNLQTAFQTFQGTSYVDRAFWFNVQDISEAGAYYGLQTGGDDGDHYTGSPKKSFSFHQTYATY